MRIVLLLIGLAACTPAAATAESAWLRVPLGTDDRVTLQNLDQHLQIVDANGTDVTYAICPALAPITVREASVKVTPLIRGSELALRSDRTVEVRTAPGVSLKPPWERWVVDLREPEQRIIGLTLPASINPQYIALRASPDLQQWSRPLDFSIADDGRLQLSNHLSADWLSISFDREPNFAPTDLRVSLATGPAQRDRQWFSVQPDAQGVVNAPLSEVVRGIRINGDTKGLHSIDIASRINSRDAWKARGRWRPGEGATTILFNGIGDHQWQLKAKPDDAALQWELAHDRMEIRIPGLPAQPLSAVAGDAPRHTLACDESLWSRASQTVQLPLQSLVTSAGNDPAGRNILPWFLGLLALVLTGFYIQSRR